MIVDRDANELYVADGYVNHRVIVFDAATGAYKRHWGAYGKRPDDSLFHASGRTACRARSAERCRTRTRPASTIPTVRPAAVSHRPLGSDCARRAGLRLRSHQRSDSGVPQGRNVREREIHRAADARQRLGVGHRVFNRSGADVSCRATTAPTSRSTSCGGTRWRSSARSDSAGRWAGQFYGAHVMAVDSKGNLFIGETYEGKRIQKFLLQGPRGGAGAAVH